MGWWIFGEELSWFDNAVLYLYQTIVLVSLLSIAFVVFLFRTRAPRKPALSTPAPDETGQLTSDPGVEGQSDEIALANGNALTNSISDEELLQAIVDGMQLVDNVSNGHDELLADNRYQYDYQHQQHQQQQQQQQQQHQEHQYYSRQHQHSNRGGDEEEEEDGDVHLAPKRRQIIREVTVRKIILPADARYSDMQKLTAKKVIGDAIQFQKRKELTDPDIENAIRNIREASKRLESNEHSPVSYGSY